MVEEKEDPRPFDVRTIRYLVRLMSEHDLSEIDLSEGDRRIQIRRGQGAAAPLPIASAPAQPQVTVTPAPVAQAAAPRVETPSKKLIEIKSPTVGTFYAQKDPDKPPFVVPGTRVTPSTIVCLIEAMKVFNEIPAEVSGVVVEVCVKNKDVVEYNTVLFRVDPAG